MTKQKVLRRLLLDISATKGCIIYRDRKIIDASAVKGRSFIFLEMLNKARNEFGAKIIYPNGRPLIKNVSTMDEKFLPNGKRAVSDGKNIQFWK